MQGGTSSSPMTSREYAFGALRCSIDNLNGDNVMDRYPTLSPLRLSIAQRRAAKPYCCG